MVKYDFHTKDGVTHRDATAAELVKLRATGDQRAIYDNDRKVTVTERLEALERFLGLR